MASGIWHVSTEPLYVFFFIFTRKDHEFASTWDGQQYICLSGSVYSLSLIHLKRCDPVRHLINSTSAMSSELGSLLQMAKRSQYFGCLYSHMYSKG